VFCQADTLREVMEDLIDDEDEMREMNLSSRPKREERRRQRERDRLEREREYERECGPLLNTPPLLL
jgi:hypothetical protein